MAGSDARSSIVRRTSKLSWLVTDERSTLRSTSSTDSLVMSRSSSAVFTARVVVPTPPFKLKKVSTCELGPAAPYAAACGGATPAAVR